MKKIEIFIAVSLVVSMLSIVLFWVAGFTGHELASCVAFITGGVFAWFALIGIGLQALRRRHLGF